MTTSRNQRVADLIRHELARILREQVRDPHVGFVTVTGVELSPDLRHAKVFVSILDSDQERTLSALHRATPYIRGALGRGARLRFTPALNFIADRTAATGARVEELLRNNAPTDPTPPEDDGASE